MQTEEKSYYICPTNHKPWVSKTRKSLWLLQVVKTISGLKTHPGGLGIKAAEPPRDHTCQHLVQTCQGDDQGGVFQRLELDQVKKPELLWSRCAILLYWRELVSCPYSSDVWEMGQADDWPSNSLVTQIAGSHIWSPSWDHKAQLPLCNSVEPPDSLGQWTAYKQRREGGRGVPKVELSWRWVNQRDNLVGRMGEGSSVPMDLGQFFVGVTPLGFSRNACCCSCMDYVLDKKPCWESK